MRWRFLFYGCLLLVTLVNLVTYTVFSSEAHQSAVHDAVNYIAMSQETFAQVHRPFAFRFLTPWIVQNLQLISGLKLDYAWVAVTFVATYLALVCFFKVLFDHFRLGLFASCLATVMLACTYYYTLFNFSDFWLVDPLNNLLTMLGLYLALRRRLVPFVVVVLIGMVNKESMLYLAPLYPLLAWARAGTWRTREVLHGALVVVAVAGSYVAFQKWAQAMVGGNEGYDPFSWHIIRLALNSRKGGEHLAIFGVFNFLWVIFLYGLYHLVRHDGPRHELIPVSAVLLAGSGFSRLFATDTERMFVMMAPAVLGVFALVISQFRGETERLLTGMLAFVYIAINYAWIPPAWAIAGNVAALAGFAVMVAMRERAAPWLPGELSPVAAGPQEHPRHAARTGRRPDRYPAHRD